MGIPTPPEMTQSASQPLTATVSGLAPGVTYSCSIAAINDRGEGDQTEDTATTQEIGEYKPCNMVTSFHLVELCEPFSCFTFFACGRRAWEQGS